jgi:hypothetical protein
LEINKYILRTYFWLVFRQLKLNKLKRIHLKRKKIHIELSVNLSIFYWQFLRLFYYFFRQSKILFNLGNIWFPLLLLLFLLFSSVHAMTLLILAIIWITFHYLPPNYFHTSFLKSKKINFDFISNQQFFFLDFSNLFKRTS